MKFLSSTCQSIDIHSKPMDWFLYDRDFRHERVNILKVLIKLKLWLLEVLAYLLTLAPIWKIEK